MTTGVLDGVYTTQPRMSDYNLVAIPAANGSGSCRPGR